MSQLTPIPDWSTNSTLIGHLMHLWLLCPPAESVEHVEEGDGHVDKDDQGEQRVYNIYSM